MEIIFGIDHGDDVRSSDDDQTSSSNGNVSVDDASGDEIHDEGPSD